jgi:hypothetical protein
VYFEKWQYCDTFNMATTFIQIHQREKQRNVIRFWEYETEEILWMGEKTTREEDDERYEQPLIVTYRPITNE